MIATPMQILNREPIKLLQNNTLIETNPCHHRSIETSIDLFTACGGLRFKIQRLVAKGTGDEGLLAEYFSDSNGYFWRG
jgi:hypothetical protein